MIGVLLVTHDALGDALIKNTRYIIGTQPLLSAVSQQPGSGYQILHKRVGREIAELDQGQGVLILVDIYGGTPSKVALSFLQEAHVAVITGVNLAMLLKVLEADRSKLPLAELANLAVESAKRAIAYNGCNAPEASVGGRGEDDGIESNGRRASKTVTVLNSLGLHASNSAKLVKAASRFKSEITIRKDDMSVNTKSIMGVLMLGATQGTRLVIEAKGDDAHMAIDALADMFEKKFDEE